jgi:tRNA threonylcarbamoyladenosine biosynthesis protein TsaB
MKLFIDTSSNEKTIVRLDDKEMVSDSRLRHSQVVIPQIQKLLKSSKKTLADISEIEVNVGPGSFTGLRVGAAIANALGFALNIPVNGKNPASLDFVIPEV